MHLTIDMYDMALLMATILLLSLKLAMNRTHLLSASSKKERLQRSKLCLEAIDFVSSHLKVIFLL